MVNIVYMHELIYDLLVCFVFCSSIYLAHRESESILSSQLSLSLFFDVYSIPILKKMVHSSSLCVCVCVIQLLCQCDARKFVFSEFECVWMRGSGATITTTTITEQQHKKLISQKAK